MQLMATGTLAGLASIGILLGTQSEASARPNLANCDSQIDKEIDAYQRYQDSLMNEEGHTQIMKFQAEWRRARTAMLNCIQGKNVGS